MKNKKNKARRIGIDARFYGTRNKGLGRYTKEIVDHVTRMDEDNEYVVFLGKENFHEYQTDNPRVRKVQANIRWYTIKEQIIMPLYFLRERLDLLHFTHFNVPIMYPKKFVVTIHDLILTKHPTNRTSTLGPIVYKIKNIGYKIVIAMAIRRARRIFAVSKYTKDDIIKKYSTPKNKIIVTYEGIAQGILNEKNINDNKVLLGYNIHSPYLLYVGNAYPHKNLETLIRVFSKLRKKYPDLSLVLVGQEDYFYNRVKNYTKTNDIAKGIIFTGYVNDSDLGILYHEALAYVFPSFFEGFGLPPLEAMRQSCPVVSSRATCLPEILKKAAVYFDPNDENEIEDSIARIINDPALRATLIKEGRKLIRNYRWDECAFKTLSVYKTI